MKPEFKHKPVCQPIRPGAFRLTHPFHFFIEERAYCIHDGYEWDGASIPNPARNIIGGKFKPSFMGPSLVHDYLYETQQGTRREADKLFRQMLRENGVSRVKAWAMYSAVRSPVGWLVYIT